jgi:hypothetical protein
MHNQLQRSNVRIIRISDNSLVPVIATFTILLEQARRIRWAKLVRQMVRMRNLHNILMGENSEGE